MIDPFGRNIDYLRLSVTQRCNLRCRYCMPDIFVPSEDTMTQSEIFRAVRAAVSVGVRKVRITGGEPLLRQDIVSICEGIAGLVRELCITTNGAMLAGMAGALRRAGVRRVNISLDTLDPQKYEWISRGGDVAQVLAGIEAAVNAGFDRVKINVVLIGGFNDDEIAALSGLAYEYPVDVRFIELMPSKFFENGYVSCDEVSLPRATKLKDDGTAELYHIPGALGNIGLIRTVSSKFCSTCNRLRLTSDGKLKPCLHSSAELDIKGMTEDDMRRAFTRAIMMKPATRTDFFTGARTMNMIGG